MSMNVKRRHFLTASAASIGTLFGVVPATSAKKYLDHHTPEGNALILLRTNKYAPPANITLDVESPGFAGIHKILGKYANGYWSFLIASDLIGRESLVSFLLDNEKYKGSSVNLRLQENSVYEYDTLDLSLSVFDDLAQSRNKMGQRLFSDQSLDQVFDVVVIGSGMGGGVLADQLAIKGLNVAVVEAGSLLFPTHIGNLPRMTKLGRFTKHIWDLWYRYGIKNYALSKGSVYDGAQGYNIGGRSLFWGAFIPRMRPYEFKSWPESVCAYLLGRGYDDAESLLKKSTYHDCEYQTTAKQYLSPYFPSFKIADAPMAIDYAKSTCQPTLPSGVFSTADLVMESILSGVESRTNYPKVFQRHPAVRVNTQGELVKGISLIDLDNDRFVEIKGRAYVLAAGSQESAKLAINSNLQPSRMIGKGMTDHPVLYTHFGLPTDHPMFRAGQAAKIVLQDRSSSHEHRPFNMLLELGADLNHGRFVNPSVFVEHQKRKKTMLCEIVFLSSIDLDERNSLSLGSDRFYAKPSITMLRQPGLGWMHDQALPLQKKIIDIFDAQALPDQDLRLHTAPQGGVAHEVGTLRMQSDDNMNETDAPPRSVVNSDLRFHYYDNLWACDLSVFPSSPAANPTLTLVALALRLANHLSSVLS
jgi:hypothetical protein